MTATMTATLPPPVAPKVSAKVRLKEWVRKQVVGKGDVRAPDIARRAKEELKKDRDFLADFGEEMLPTAVYELVLDVLSEGRQDVGGIDAIPGGGVKAPNGSTDSRAALKIRLEMLTARYSRWMEWVGDRHVNLLKLDAPLAEKAINLRRKRGDGEHRVADFLHSLQSRIEPGKTIGESLDLEQIEFIHAAMTQPREEDVNGNL